MNSKGLQQIVPVIAMTLALAGCGGGGDIGSSSGANGSGSNGNGSSGGDSGGSTTTNASPGGIWRGTDSISGLQVIGLVDESGDFNFIRSDGVQYVGSATVSTNTVTASFEGFVPLGDTFTDGSTHGTGNLSGTIQARTSIDLTSQFKTDNGSTSSGTLDLTFDTLYNRASSLATLAGNFTSPSSGVVVTVSSNGTIFSQDASTGCVINGTASIINASYNAYHVEFTYASCTGQAAVLNGVQFAGLATLDNEVSPEQAVIGVTGTSSSAKYAVTLLLNRS
ncbi:MAG TPA: hypothetical protein VHB68_09065 [Steroidobacteraceae bacterium]|nr:hypothetical protein [Steroidobacteraceae bacterium]